VPRSIVVGYDASDGANAALDTAIEYARLIEAKLVVVFSFEIPAAYGGETGDYRRAVREIGEHAMVEAVERVSSAGVEYTTELVPKRPAEGLVAAAEEHEATLIVIGTHGERPLTGAILGSVPHKLLHISDVPVLIVPSRRED